MDVPGAAAQNRKYKNFWSWHGPEDLITVLTIIFWILISYYWGKSGIVMSSSLALTFCVSPLHAARFGGPGKWTRYHVWMMRIATAIGLGWMFVEFPDLGTRLAAIAVAAALYIACERIGWRWTVNRRLAAG